MFPSKHLPKNYVFKHSTFYTKDTIKRENNLPLLPNSLNLLLVSLWGKLMTSWASSTSASTSSCPWSSASISSWSWSPSYILSKSNFIFTTYFPSYLFLKPPVSSSFSAYFQQVSPPPGLGFHGCMNIMRFQDILWVQHFLPPPFLVRDTPPFSLGQQRIIELADVSNARPNFLSRFTYVFPTNPRDWPLLLTPPPQESSLDTDNALADHLRSFKQGQIVKRHSSQNRFD